jgi:hypothetical protein
VGAEVSTQDAAALDVPLSSAFEPQAVSSTPASARATGTASRCREFGIEQPPFAGVCEAHTMEELLRLNESR